MLDVMEPNLLERGRDPLCHGRRAWAGFPEEEGKALEHVPRIVKLGGPRSKVEASKKRPCCAQKERRFCETRRVMAHRGSRKAQSRGKRASITFCGKGLGSGGLGRAEQVCLSDLLKGKVERAGEILMSRKGCAEGGGKKMAKCFLSGWILAGELATWGRKGAKKT